MQVDGLTAAADALAGLLGEFRAGHIADLRCETNAISRHVGPLSARWNRRFGGFPEGYFPFTSLRSELSRGVRDEYLKRIIVAQLRRHGDGAPVIVNPACVFGHHARELARRLPSARVIAADIDPSANRLFRMFPGPEPDNFEFRCDNVYDSQLNVHPTAVVFFGACGALSDGAMDLAIEASARFLMCRTCCHDNIGGNIDVVPRPTLVNRLFRLKNVYLGRVRKKQKIPGFYFAERYEREGYPRSVAARGLSGWNEFHQVCRHSPESDVCRAIIDLDRYLYLSEHGYNVWYRGELFFAERT